MWHNPSMKFLIGMAIGGGIGYVLGTAAGRERFEEIVAGMEGVLGEEKMQQVTDFLDQGTSEIRKAANEGLENASAVIDATTTENGDES
jgi:tryptophan synthase beta subunit